MLAKDKQVLTIKKKIAMIGAAFAALLFVSILSIGLGTASASCHEIIGAIIGQGADGGNYHIIQNIRMPRIVTGILVGMNLAVSGVLLQGVLRNPMASPNIIGVNAGAGLAAISIMALFPQNIQLITPASFIGALLASLLIYFLAAKTGQSSSTVHIVLAGMAVSALLNAVTNGIMMINSDVLDVTFSWTLGSLSGRSWSAVKMILPYSLAGLVLAIVISPKLNLFELGDEIASSMGLRIGLYRVMIIMVASLLAGSAVAAAGTIGFVGLIAPHIGRLMIGSDHRFLIPLSALLGGVLLVFSDTLARTVFQPVELSVGIVTAILGAPFFLYLLKKSQRKEG